ncbi:hypothetical protein SynROS8604_01819 [Synechococcus sp. ROS8604]|nr:hypothetical protein SynROS8604_01819 [Synechococcus sp. ROS8604]
MINVQASGPSGVQQQLSAATGVIGLQPDKEKQSMDHEK